LTLTSVDYVQHEVAEVAQLWNSVYQISARHLQRRLLGKPMRAVLAFTGHVITSHWPVAAQYVRDFWTQTGSRSSEAKLILLA